MSFRRLFILVLAVLLIAGFFNFGGYEWAKGLFEQSPDTSTSGPSKPSPDRPTIPAPEPTEPEPAPYPESFWDQWTGENLTGGRFTSYYHEEGIRADTYPRDKIVGVENGREVIKDADLATAAKEKALYPFPGHAALVQFASNQMFDTELYDSADWMTYLVDGGNGLRRLGATGRNMFLGLDGHEGILPTTMSDDVVVYTTTYKELRERFPDVTFYNSRLSDGKIVGNGTSNMRDDNAVIVWERLNPGPGEERLLLVLKVYCGNTFSVGPVKPNPVTPPSDTEPSKPRPSDPPPGPEPSDPPRPTDPPTPIPKDPREDPNRNGNGGSGGGHADEDGPGIYQPSRPDVPPDSLTIPSPPVNPENDTRDQTFPGGTGGSIPVQPVQPDLGNTGGTEGQSFTRGGGTQQEGPLPMPTDNTGNSNSNNISSDANSGSGGGQNETTTVNTGDVQEGPPAWQD